MKNILLGMLLCSLAVIFLGCAKNKEPDEKIELLIYCGITMIHPMEEIAAAVELECNCTIRFMTGGSGSILRSIEYHKVGDLFLPGAESFILQCQEKKLLRGTSLVGYNQAALMVKKGNPKNISADIGNLAKNEFSVILGDPENGSIGRESRRLLMAQGIYHEVLTNSSALVADSGDITQAIKNGVVDLSLNWSATTKWLDNGDYVEIIHLDEEIAPINELIIGQLVFSTQPALAKHFVDYATSSAGRKIFRAYGFFDSNDLSPKDSHGHISE